eukprot:6472617-Amphidinium_carterae.3
MALSLDHHSWTLAPPSLATVLRPSEAGKVRRGGTVAEIEGTRESQKGKEMNRLSDQLFEQLHIDGGVFSVGWIP